MVNGKEKLIGLKLVELGATLVCIKEAIEHSKLVICQVNKNMPRTFGDTTIHESQIDVIVEQDAPLPELPVKEFSDEDIKIGKLIAENFIEDGSTLQVSDPVVAHESQPSNCNSSV